MAVTIPAAAVTTAEHRQRPAPQHNDRDAGQQRDEQPPAPCTPPGPAAIVSMTAPAAAASTTVASHWLSATPAANQRLAGTPAPSAWTIRSHATTVTSASARRIVLKDDAAVPPILPAWGHAVATADRHPRHPGPTANTTHSCPVASTRPANR